MAMPVVNKATLVMLQATIDYYIEGYGYSGESVEESPEHFSAERWESTWADDVKKYPEDKDEAWFPLMKRTTTRRTINWHYISQKIIETVRNESVC